MADATKIILPLVLLGGLGGFIFWLWKKSKAPTAPPIVQYYNPLDEQAATIIANSFSTTPYRGFVDLYTNKRTTIVVGGGAANPLYAQLAENQLFSDTTALLPGQWWILSEPRYFNGVRYIGISGYEQQETINAANYFANSNRLLKDAYSWK
jgi:hypothetical protein